MRATTPRRLGLAVVALTVVTSLVAGPAGSTSATSATSAVGKVLPGPFVSLLFSRTEITAAIDCKADDEGVARLDTVVAPYLHSLGMTASGTLTTGNIRESGEACTHYHSSMMASWAQAKTLANEYGWHFVSHTATYPGKIATLPPERLYDETCGSAKAIDAHGLPGGHGLIAYPGSQALPADVQADYSAKCFAWGRRYNPDAITDISAGTRAPYWQVTAAPSGGPCNDRSKSCYDLKALGDRRYVLPSVQIAHVHELTPGKWMTLQAFVLVTGTSPAGSSIRWDCTSNDPEEHWTTDNERYCLSDWKQVVAAVAARPDVTVTDPLTVGIAFGRPAHYSF